MSDKPSDLADERREYSYGALSRADLSDDPVEQFEQWMVVAREQELHDPTAMTLATVDERGMPYQRVVLLKGVSQAGFVFFTNLESRKAGHIRDNQRVSLHFGWLPLDRQVIINGVAEPLSKSEVLRYFLTRPRESQLAAWASEQSKPISARSVLLAQFDKMKRKFDQGEVPLPSFWGGYRVVPESIEFWQGGTNRLHDRFLYHRESPKSGEWSIERLSP